MSTAEDVATDCDITSIQHTAQAERPLLKCFWAITFLITLSITIWQTISLIDKLNAKETVAQITINGGQRSRFPAVTICNQNAYKNSAVHRLPQLTTLLYAYSLTLQSNKNKTSNNAADHLNHSSERGKRAVSTWAGTYWLGGYVKSPTSNGVWEPANTSIDAVINVANKDKCNCDSKLAIDVSQNSADCDFNVQCTNTKPVCVSKQYQVRCVDSKELLVPVCRAVADNNCNQPCPKVSSLVFFLLHKGVCYYVKNCGSSCVVTYEKAEQFCETFSVNGKKATLLHSVTDSDLTSWLVHLLKAHYKSNDETSKAKCRSPYGDDLCCKGFSLSAQHLFTSDTPDDMTVPSIDFQPCAADWTAPALTPGTQAATTDLCGGVDPITIVPKIATEPPSPSPIATEPSTTTTTATTTTTSTTPTTPPSTLPPFVEAKYSASEVANYLNLSAIGDSPLAVQTTVAESVPYIVGVLDEEQRISLGYTQSDLVVNCGMGRQPCDMKRDWFQWNDVVMGNCYTFNGNANPSPYFVSRPGLKTGLQLLLNVSQSEYLATMEKIGLRVFIHSPNDPIIGVQDGGSAFPGYLISYQINYFKNVRLRPPTGKLCGFGTPAESYNYPIDYSQEACLRSCYQAAVITNCSCADPKFRYPENVKACDLANRSCVDNFAAEHDFDDLSCNCPDPCDDDRYERTSTFAKLTPLKVCTTFNESADCTSSVKNLSLVRVYFSSLSYRLMEDELRYNSQKLWTDLSNVLNLLLNWTVISIFEVLIMILFPCCEKATAIYRRLSARFSDNDAVYRRRAAL